MLAGAPRQLRKPHAPAHARHAAEWSRQEDARFAASGRVKTTAARRDDRHRRRKAADRDKCCSDQEPVHRTDRRARMLRRRERFPTRRGEKAFAASVAPCGGVRRRYGMIRKSGYRFSEKIMPKQAAKAKW